MKSMQRRTLWWGCALGVCLQATSAASQAAVNLDRTRVIFNDSDKSTSIVLENQSKQLPYLAQAWIENEKGDKDSTHLIALPPIQRIEAGQKSQVRIMKLTAADQLPKDRESLFYFNVREVPPKSDKENVMQIAIQSRVKLFYRPASIKPREGDIWQERLQVAQTAPGAIKITNPTPYYITIGYLGSDEGHNFAKFDSLMVAPFASENYTAPNYSGSRYALGYIDDYGGLNIRQYDCSSTQCALQPAKKP